MNYEIGAQWRQWDLHFHTPASYDYGNKGVTNIELVAALKSADLCAVAITDHHFIDVQRIKDIQKIAGNDLTIFPGIELRSELGGSESVHFIGIFPEKCELEEVWTKISGRLNITPSDVTSKGDDRVYCDFSDAADCIHELGGIVSVHAGKKANSIENISNAENFKQAVKADLARKAIDLFEVGKLPDVEDYRRIVFPFLKRDYPLIICSDNHDANDYVPKAPLWIKADPTFQGLKQVINEPQDRCFIGEIPPKLVTVSNNKTKYIRQIEIKKQPGSNLQETWFNNILPLNSGLVAIIGNKGKGKSALTDTIGLLGNTKQSQAFSFLTDKNFKNPRDNKARHFRATLTWESGNSNSTMLDNPVDETKPELVKYIPQNFLEVICNEIGGEHETDFDRELKKVIFSHASEVDRLGKTSLDELIDYKTSEANDTIDLLKAELHQTNEEIVSLEEQSRQEFKKNIENLLSVKEQELDSHTKSKPQPVPKPQNDPGKQQSITTGAEEIEAAKKRRDEFEGQIRLATDARQKQAVQISSVDKLLAKLDNFHRQIELFKSECGPELQAIGLTVDDIIKIAIKRPILISKREEFIAAKKVAEDLLTATNENGPVFKKAAVEKVISELQVKLDEPNKKYQAYTAALKTWERNRLVILGDDSTAGSVVYLKKQIEDLKVVPAKLTAARQSRLTKAKGIHAEIRKLSGAYRALYAPVHQFIQERPLAKDKFHLNFEVAIVDAGFQPGFFSVISHAIAGTFCGVEEGAKALRAILARHDFNGENGIEAFLEEVMECLQKDKRTKDMSPVDICKLLRQGKTLLELYDFVFALDYLRPRYTLRMGDKELHQLSPGERGTLLLVFYLLIDKGDIPLVIDQPEENLDNQTVYELLVPCIKEAKERRQIVIVTHNPNLAVVCDAEQVIGASLDKPHNQRMDYIAGAIENPRINKLIVDILEGTRPAFDNRDSKYLPE